MSAAQDRVLALIFALQGHSFEGLRLKAIASAIGQSPSTTLRDLETLASAGIAERIPGREDCWRLGPRIVQLAIAHQTEVARVQQRLDDFTQRYSRIP